MKNKKIIYALLILLIILIISLVFIVVMPNKKENQKQIDPFSLENIEKIQMCTNDNCPNIKENIYADISYDSDIASLQERIKKINQDTKNYYNQSKKSNMNDASCENVKNQYTHSIMTDTEYITYTGKKYISISVKRITGNICTDEIKHLPIETYIFNIDTKKEITSQQLKKELGITDEQIISSISTNIEELNKNNNTNFTINEVIENNNDYTLYYNTLGKLCVEYYQKSDDSYYSALIK